MYSVRQSSLFKKDIKKIKNRKLDISKLQYVIKILVSGSPLSAMYKDHKLIGNWKGYRECHISPDWLLIYKISNNELMLSRTGTHSDLFGK